MEILAARKVELVLDFEANRVVQGRVLPPSDGSEERTIQLDAGEGSSLAASCAVGPGGLFRLRDVPASQVRLVVVRRSHLDGSVQSDVFPVDLGDEHVHTIDLVLPETSAAPEFLRFEIEGATAADLHVLDAEDRLVCRALVNQDSRLEIPEGAIRFYALPRQSGGSRLDFARAITGPLPPGADRGTERWLELRFML